ncbi:hypothetical protein PYCCODRAFT_703932 [Trametes coccinea BRFM310]|uniref:Uncharacterized protein n=1 Tax=Trametes coccinea (strain BRFM310) TaxID=1353009 RepID=A0A1Y2IGZ5_TRAC3|nr:hypothetical protein PYCCODRAFT_703932 [Trametes coccinea BRFM310]
MLVSTCQHPATVESHTRTRTRSLLRPRISSHGPSVTGVCEPVGTSLGTVLVSLGTVILRAVRFVLYFLVAAVRRTV